MEPERKSPRSVSGELPAVPTRGPEPDAEPAEAMSLAQPVPASELEERPPKVRADAIVTPSVAESAAGSEYLVPGRGPILAPAQTEESTRIVKTEGQTSASSSSGLQAAPTARPAKQHEAALDAVCEARRVLEAQLDQVRKGQEAMRQRITARL